METTIKTRVGKLLDVTDQRSAWSRGVLVYAHELLDFMLEAELQRLARMDRGTVSAETKRFNLSNALLGVALPFGLALAEALCGKATADKIRAGVLAD